MRGIFQRPHAKLSRTKLCSNLVKSVQYYRVLLLAHTVSLLKYSLVPRPHPLRGEGSRDIGAISWSCTPSRDSIELNLLSHMNAELAQPRNRSNVTRSFSSQRVQGSGDETS